MLDQSTKIGARPAAIPRRVIVRSESVRSGQAPTGLIVAGALLGSGMAVIGSFLPWIKAEFLFMSMEISGVKGGDGIISLVAGVTAGVLALFILGQNAKLFGALTMIAGAVAAATALYDIGHYYQMVSEQPLVGGLTQLAE